MQSSSATGIFRRFVEARVPLSAAGWAGPDARFRVVAYEAGRSYTLRTALPLGALLVHRRLHQQGGRTYLTHEVEFTGFSRPLRWVVLTHLHLDHVDGLRYFPQADILVSQTELQRPYGTVPGLLPPWFRPRPVRYANSPLPAFAGGFALTRAADVWLVPTPGHSHGQQSVVVLTPEATLLFAGDLTFDEGQLLRAEVAGICVDKAAAADTLARVRRHCRTTPTVYLPSHDAQAADRLARLQPTALHAP